MIKKIEKIIKEKITPKLNEHNGDIKIIDFSKGILKVKLLGSCLGCPQAQLTMEDLVRRVLLEEVPEVKDVTLEHTVSEELLSFAKKILNK